MRSFLLVLSIITLLISPSLSEAQQVDVTVSGKVLDSDSRLLLPNIRVDIVNSASGDTLGAVHTDSLGQFTSAFTVATSIEEITPVEYEIEEAYPNPTSGGIVTINYTSRLPAAKLPELELFDMLGRKLSSPQLGASGVYLVRLRFEDGATSKSTQVVKLDGPPISFSLVSRVSSPTAAQSNSSGGLAKVKQRGITVVFSHPAYTTVAQDFDTSANLSSLVVPLDAVFATVVADEEIYDVTYDPDAIILTGPARAALVEADTVNQRYTFDSTILNDAGITLEQGKPILIEGLALRRITSVSTSGTTTQIETEFAPITDVVQAGTISWNHAAQFDESTMRKATVSGKAARVSERADSLMFEFKVDPYEFKIRIDRAPSDTVRSKMTIQVTKTIDNKLSATFIGKALLKDFESSGSFQFNNSETESMSLENKNVRIDMEMSLAAAGSGIDAVNWKVPEVVLPIKFLVGPVPITLNVKVQVVLNMSVKNEASATATTKLSYSGTTGVEYDGTEFELKQETIDHLLGATNTDAGSSIGNLVDANLGIAFPRLTVEIFAVPIIPSFLVGFVVGSNLSWGPVCKRGYVSVELKAAVDLKFLNLTYNVAEKELFKERKDSPPC